jgi:hypothetical protein
MIEHGDQELVLNMVICGTKAQIAAALQELSEEFNRPKTDDNCHGPFGGAEVDYDCRKTRKNTRRFIKV